MSQANNVQYSFVKIRIVKADKPTYWYANRMGEVMEVRKRITDGHTTYQAIYEKDPNSPNAAFEVGANDAEEI